MTILLVEHDMDFVMGLTDRLVVMDFGEKLAEGMPADDPARSGGAAKRISGGVDEARRMSRCSKCATCRVALRQGRGGARRVARGRTRAHRDGDRSQRRGQDDAARRDHGPVAVARRRSRYAGERVAGSTVEQRVARGLVLVPEKRELFGDDDGRGQSASSARSRAAARRARLRCARSTRSTSASRACRAARAACRNAVGRRAADAGARPRADGAAELLMLDEPSLGLAPLIVREIFSIVAALRATGVSILLVEQNARAALQVADYGYVLETGELRARRAERRARRQSAGGGDLSGAGPRRADVEAGRACRRIDACGARAAPSARLIPSALDVSHDRPLRSSRRRSARSPTPSTCCSRPPASTRPRCRACSPRSTTHDVDFADLYFQHARFESWSLEEGIVKSGSVQHRPRRRRARGHRRQAGVRVLRRHLAARRSTKRRTRCARSARQGQSAVGAARRARRRARRCTRAPIRSRASPKPTKVALLERLERMARARDPRVTQVMASLAGEHETMLIARSDGVIVADVRPLVRMSITVIVEENGRREQGYARRRRALRLRVLHRRDARATTRSEAVDAGAAQPRRARRAGRQDDRRARARLARHPAARGDRPRARGRLQPQGHERVLRPRRQARRGARASRSSTTARSSAAAARSTSTTRATRRSAPC